MLSCRVVDAWPAPSLSRLPTATPGPAEPHGELDARGAWISLTSNWVPGELGSDRCTSAVTVPPAARITDEAVPLFCAIAPMIGLKSHVRRMLRSGTVVPPFVLTGAAEAVVVARGNAAAEIARIAAQRVNSKVGRVIDKVSIVFTVTAMTAVTPTQ